MPLTMKKTWKRPAALANAREVMPASRSLNDAATRLGVDKSTVFRWIKAGHIPAPAGPVASGDAQPPVPLTDEATFVLMCGEYPRDGVRLLGWVELAMGEHDLAAMWAAHSAALITEAGAHRFQPFALTHKAPTGSGFEVWRRRFLAEHRY